jgi:hypothetical protein
MYVYKTNKTLMVYIGYRLLPNIRKILRMGFGPIFIFIYGFGFWLKCYFL